MHPLVPVAGLGGLVLAVSAAPAPLPIATGPATDADGPVPVILSAFLGLDDALPPGAGLLCLPDPPMVTGLDGMPVVLSRRIDAATLDAHDFAVVTRSGRVLVPECATLNPANDAGEERTVLLLGELGDEGSDPAMQVLLVDEVLTLDGEDLSRTVPSARVTRLAAGPSLVWVEPVDPKEVGAPPATTIALRACWAGGIVALDGDEVEPEDWGRYALTVATDDGPITVAPIAVGDLGDNDNNHLLFFDAPGIPFALSMPADVVVDPHGEPNAATTSVVRH